MFLKISLIRPATTLKQIPALVFFCEFCEIYEFYKYTNFTSFKKAYFEEQLRTAASVNQRKWTLIWEILAVKIFEYSSQSNSLLTGLAHSTKSTLRVGSAEAEHTIKWSGKNNDPTPTI